MPDEAAKKSDEEVLNDIRAAIEDLSIEELRGYIRIVKEMKMDVDWENFGARIVGIYHRAIKEEMGEAAAQAYATGIFKRLGN